MYLITGATGTIGQELVPRLLKQGESIRLFTRSQTKAQHWQSQAEIYIGDFEDLDSLKRALDGVKAVFLLTRGDEVGNHHIENFLQAADQQRVVFLSNLGAGLPSNPLSQGHLKREQMLIDRGMPLSILRPGSFMSNCLRWKAGIQQSKTVIHPNADGRSAPIAPGDIAEVALRTLTTADWVGQILELTGPESMTTAEQVKILAQLLNQPLTCQETEIETSIENMIRRGMPHDFAQAMGQVIAGVRRGEADKVTETVKQITGRPAQRFSDWARERANVWLSA